MENKIFIGRSIILSTALTKPAQPKDCRHFSLQACTQNAQAQDSQQFLEVVMGSHAMLLTGLFFWGFLGVLGLRNVHSTIEILGPVEVCARHSRKPWKCEAGADFVTFMLSSRQNKQYAQARKIHTFDIEFSMQ